MKEIIETLKSIDVKTYSYVRIVIENVKNSKLLKLLDYLWVHKKRTLKKDLVYKAVFQEKYAPEKDALLRNEIRLLKKELVVAIGSREASYEEHSLNYLKFLSRKGLKAVFEKESKKLRVKLELSGNSELLYDLEVLELYQFYKNEMKGSVKDFEVLEKYMNQSQMRLDEVDTIHRRKIDVFKAFISEGKKRLGLDQSYASGLPEPNVESSHQVHYLYHKKMGLVAQDKISHLTKALDHLHKAAMDHQEKEEEIVVLSNNLALQHFFLRDYEKAVIVYESFLFSNRLSKTKFILVLFNYMSALIKNANYQKANKLFKKYLTNFQNNLLTSIKAVLMYAMNGLYLNSLKDVKEVMLTLDMKSGSADDYYYARLVWAAYHWKKNDLDSAERECVNTLQAIKERDRYMSYWMCAKSMLDYLRTDEAGKQTAISARVEDFLNDPKYRHGDILPLLWLRDEMFKQ